MVHPHNLRCLYYEPLVWFMIIFSTETINRIFDYSVGVALINFLTQYLIIHYHCGKL